VAFEDNGLAASPKQVKNETSLVSLSTLDAGDFSVWVTDMRSAIEGASGSRVPCDDCTACCRSSQFVHIGPEETDSLDHIPNELLFPAPGWPKGHVLMGYNEHGQCPMLIDDRCSIYEHRPGTCRTYDCRIFAASGLTITEKDKVLIRRQAERWRFSYPSGDDESRHAAGRAAGQFLVDHADDLPPELAPVNTTQRAVLAFRIHELFLGDTLPEVAAVVASLRTLRS
jgi:uncharacterized protein